MIIARRRPLSVQRLFVFEQLSGVTMYVVPEFFRAEPRRLLCREDIDINRTRAVELAVELAQALYDATVLDEVVVCELPIRVSEPGVFGTRQYEIGLVRIPIPIVTQPKNSHKRYLKTLVSHPQADRLLRTGYCAA